jgi:predicted phage-related endonuclease
MSRIWLGTPGNEQLLPTMGRQFAEEDFEAKVIERRVASGRLVKEVSAVKKRFRLDYSFVTNAILKQLKELYQSGIHNNLNLKIEQEDGSIEEYEVVFRPFSRSRYLIGDTWYWEGISIELEEV